MQAELIRASDAHRPVISNLMQFYIYDFSEFVSLDVEPNGLFAPYPTLGDYWNNDPSRFPYVIKFNDNYIGFVLVRVINSKQPDYFSIGEFFIMRHYRKMGIGKFIAFRVFDLHRGQWEVFQKESNLPAQKFWLKVIDEYTRGQFKQIKDKDRITQEFNNAS